MLIIVANTAELLLVLKVEDFEKSEITSFLYTKIKKYESTTFVLLPQSITRYCMQKSMNVPITRMESLQIFNICYDFAEFTIIFISRREGQIIRE